MCGKMLFTWFFYLLIFFGDIISQIDSQTINTTRRSLVNDDKKLRTPMHKAVLTQRGYIQFLRWQLPVPEINEFTFCLWVKSTNFTYPHSIFSYSKNEKSRLVRAWIAPQGQSIHLEINNVELFGQPTSIQVDRWYHICQSWDNERGRYGLWINGRNELDGYAPEMAGHVIPNNGDIVLGQEYTDFDKGLEEGIEGAVLGFNLLLASAFRSSGGSFEQNQLIDDESSVSSIDLPDLIPRRQITKGIGPALFPHTLRYPLSHRYARQPLIHDTMKSVSKEEVRIVRIRKARQTPNIFLSSLNGGEAKTLDNSISMGMRLIEMGYYHCEIGRGSPFVGGKLLLISWTRTPVRIFGGALLKNVNSQCGVFDA